jgi:uncharacterized protein
MKAMYYLRGAMIMPHHTLTPEERSILLKIARSAIESAVRGESLPPVHIDQLPGSLQDLGASFVTLTTDGQLRGCIGALEASQPLALDVQEHAIGAALQDFRFPPVEIDELCRLKIEVSYLTDPESLVYSTPQDLLNQLIPGETGVILQDGWRRATFLPQVWNKIPQASDFLDQLCSKMNVPAGLWRRKHLDVFIYKVEEFSE